MPLLRSRRDVRRFRMWWGVRFFLVLAVWALACLIVVIGYRVAGR